MSTRAVEIAGLNVAEAAAIPFPKQRSMLVVFSGIGGTGKTRIAHHLESTFRRHGIQVQYQWLYGGSSTFSEVMVRLGGRALPSSERKLRQPSRSGIRSSLGKACWYLLVGIDLARFCIFKVRLPLLLGKVVICDRYTFDTFSDIACQYEQEPRSAELNLFEKLFHFLYPKPDLHYLLLADPGEVQKWEGAPPPSSREDRAAKIRLYTGRYQRHGNFLVRHVDGDFDRLEREISNEALKHYWSLVQADKGSGPAGGGLGR